MPKHKKNSKKSASSQKSKHKHGNKKNNNVKKASKKSGKPNKAQKKVVKDPKLSKQAKLFEMKSNALIQKGRDRGFVTYDEILKEFPQIEDDIAFLDELYTKLSTANVDILEGGGILEVEDLKDKKGVPAYSRGSDSAYDSIQMYLKEIGQYPLINAAKERSSPKESRTAIWRQKIFWLKPIFVSWYQ